MGKKEKLVVATALALGLARNSGVKSDVVVPQELTPATDHQNFGSSASPEPIMVRDLPIDATPTPESDLKNNGSEKSIPAPSPSATPEATFNQETQTPDQYEIPDFTKLINSPKIINALEKAPEQINALWRIIVAEAGQIPDSMIAHQGENDTIGVYRIDKDGTRLAFMMAGFGGDRTFHVQPMLTLVTTSEGIEKRYNFNFDTGNISQSISGPNDEYSTHTVEQSSSGYDLALQELLNNFNTALKK